MKVSKLIELLKKFPQNMLVLVAGYEGGYDNPELPVMKPIKKQDKDLVGYLGIYDNALEGDKKVQIAVVIGRKYHG